MSAALLLLICLLATAGFALIALSQKQHKRALPASWRRRSPAIPRLSGAALIGAAAFPAVARDGWAFGLLVWATMLTVAALLVVAGLAKLRGNGRGQNENQ